MIDNNINKVINLIHNIIVNEDKEPLDVLGGKIVGLIGGMENIEIMYDHYPLLEVIANLGSELKFTTDKDQAQRIYSNIQEYLIQLRSSVHA